MDLDWVRLCPVVVVGQSELAMKNGVAKVGKNHMGLADRDLSDATEADQDTASRNDLAT